MPWQDVDMSEDQERDFDFYFKQKTRFLVDESLGEEVARIIRSYRYNALFANEIGLGGRSDEDLYAYAWKENRMLLTHDHDFLDDRRFPFNRCPGVIVLPGGAGDERALDLALAEILLVIAPYRLAHIYEKIEIHAGREWTVKGWNKHAGEHYRTRLRLPSDGRVQIWTD
jgi:predicted nuclease of predicted toxin-antitoxin system